ncbi:MAG: hypothetical protein OXE79_05385 [Acidimicrobiaceae bacterium]|nr:hypothetical protein [Acidimicrobiaceae bacterium]MCY4279640.1 hypothetical protein [Acidimicrobiaceae bacterium]
MTESRAVEPKAAEPGDTEPKAVTSEAVARRRRETALAGHRGDTDTARAHLRDREAVVRCSALRALQRARDLAAAELHEALADPEPAVRLTGLELAAERDDIAVEKIAALLDDEDSGVVEAAAWACGEKVSAGHQQDRDSAGATLAALSRLALQHRDLLCRESAIAALGAISDPAGLPAILAGLDDKPEVRRRAVVALAPFEGPEVEAALHKAGSDRDRQVRAAAAELLSL